MTPQFAATWLAVALAVCALVGQALKTDTFDGILARLSIPPVPKTAVPWVTLFVGVAGSFLAGLQMQASWQEALAQAVLGGVSSLFATAGHELFARSNSGPAADDPQKRGPSGGTGVAGSALRMVLIGALFACARLLPGCQAFEQSKLPSDLKDETTCAVTQIENGVTSVKDLAAACFSQELALAEDALAFLLTSTDFRSAHPDAVPKLTVSLKAARDARACGSGK